LSLASALRKNILEPANFFIEDYSHNIRKLTADIKKEDKIQKELSFKLEKVIIYELS